MVKLVEIAIFYTMELFVKKRNVMKFRMDSEPSGIPKRQVLVMFQLGRKELSV